jgi:hypothetical protein
VKEDVESRYEDLLALDVPMWITLPFDADPSNVEDSLQEELIELQCDSEAKSLFTLRGYQAMWIQMSCRYPNLWMKAELLFVAFPTTWLVEAGFSAVTVLLSKARNRLNITTAGDLRLYLTKCLPDIPSLVAKHQAQGSH